MASLASCIRGVAASRFGSRGFARWGGEIKVPGNPVRFVVELPSPDSGRTAVLSMPLHNLVDIPVEVQTVEGDIRLRFSVPTLAAQCEASAAPDRTFEGTWSQNGAQVPLSLWTLADGEEAGEPTTPSRPQTPAAPFPYDVEEVQYASQVDNCTLAGTLTLPRGHGLVPAVLLLTGSGAHDRDETIFGHKPFWVIADELSRNGVAVLRVDDRGVGGSEQGSAERLTETFASDAQSGVALLRGHPRVDPRRVGLLGHSEGGLTAALAAADANPAFIVMLAGPGVSGRDTLLSQNRAVLSLEGASDAQTDRVVECMATVLDKLGGDTLSTEFRADVVSLVQAQLAANRQTTPELTSELIDAAVSQMAQPWMRQFVDLDPYEHLTQVRCPVLALCGTKDVQVLHDLHLPRIEEALHIAGVPMAVAAMADLNHLFQRAETGSVDEYALIEHTMDPAALSYIRGWILTTTGQPDSAS